MSMEFLNKEPFKQKGGPKRGWRCPENDPPGDLARVEIIGGTGNVLHAVYRDGRFFIASHGEMVVAYVPMGWRQTG